MVLVFNRESPSSAERASVFSTMSFVPQKKSTSMDKVSPVNVNHVINPIRKLFINTFFYLNNFIKFIYAIYFDFVKQLG